MISSHDRVPAKFGTCYIRYAIILDGGERVALLPNAETSANHRSNAEVRLPRKASRVGSSLSRHCEGGTNPTAAWSEPGPDLYKSAGERPPADISCNFPPFLLCACTLRDALTGDDRKRPVGNCGLRLHGRPRT